MDKEKKWNSPSLESLVMLGMIIKEGKRETVADAIDKTLVSAVMRGVERGYYGWKKVAYINTTVTRIRHKLAVFWGKSRRRELQEIDDVLRNYAKAGEWPNFIKNEFIYDEKIGLGVARCAEEAAKDLINYVWEREKQGEEVGKIWKEAWEKYKWGGESERIDGWIAAAEQLTDMEIDRRTYNNRGKIAPFPMGTGGHKHVWRGKIKWDNPIKEVFVKNNCAEVWDYMQRADVMRVWTDASVSEKGMAAVVLVENHNFGRDKDESGKGKTKRKGRAKEDKDTTEEIHCFKVRGNAFRAEGLGLLGAMKIMKERGNREKTEELAFVCDNKSNIELAKRWEEEEELVSVYEFQRESRKVIEDLKRQWGKIVFLHVKGHVGIQQNEICDQKAKNEAERCAETIPEEIVERFGEIRDKGMKIESRGQLKKGGRFFPQWEEDIMKEARGEKSANERGDVTRECTTF